MQNDVIHVKVGQKHIDTPKISPRTSTCMIVQAVKEATGSDNVRCGFTTCGVDDIMYVLPTNVRNAIWQWDADQPVMPFEFDMEKYRIDS